MAVLKSGKVLTVPNAAWFAASAGAQPVLERIAGDNTQTPQVRRYAANELRTIKQAIRLRDALALANPGSTP